MREKSTAESEDGNRGIKGWDLWRVVEVRRINRENISELSGRNNMPVFSKERNSCWHGLARQDPVRGTACHLVHPVGSTVTVMSSDIILEEFEV